MNRIELFMKIYMYELEIYLNTHKTEILKISFQSDEANTDRPLKEYLKYVIENKCNRILSDISEVIIGQNKTYNITEEVRKIHIEQVLLPDEISDDLKTLLSKRKKAVYTNPDICLRINNNGNINYETVELKSTKNDAIPGSSVQQVSPDEWVIFIKHTNNSVNITTGMYFHAINTKMQFPDRSPRPQVSFSELENWNNKHRICHINKLHYQSSTEDTVKRELLCDWQGVLAKRWTNILLTFDKSKNEPWFNNNLRKFILEFLTVYDEFNDVQKEEYKALISSLIEK